MQVTPENVKIDFKRMKKHNLSWEKATVQNFQNVTFEDALVKRLSACYVSDVPLALLSSGGVDSSALIKIAERVPNIAKKIAIHLDTKNDPDGLRIRKICKHRNYH